MEPGQVKSYTVILRANGKEITLTAGLTFSSSNPDVVLINEDGDATGVGPGSVTISVTWQDLSAHGQIDVVGSCADTHQNFAVLIDNSTSMGQAFSASYSTKLAFSKSIASDFADTVNYSKDKISVWKFGDAPALLSDFGIDATAARAAITSIAGGTEKTNLADALGTLIGAFPSGSTRVIILFSDGEYTGDDPGPIAQSFKDTGGVLVIVAVRAWGTAFQKLAEMASAGFLLSAYGATEAGILDTLSGLKGYLCSSECNVVGATAPKAQLNYDAFINWDVVTGLVDLLGLGIWDVLGRDNGQGLYVDMMGSATLICPTCGLEAYGKLQSKSDYAFTAGQTYRFTISAAGNHVGRPEPFTIRIRVGNELDEDITITDPKFPMTPFPFTWTVASSHSGKITIEQTANSGHPNQGTLIDDILLENVTTVTTMLHEDFNGENPTTIDPSPSMYGGCLSTPPGSQAADPLPLHRVIE